MTDSYPLKHFALLLLLFGFFACETEHTSSEETEKEYLGIEEEVFNKLCEEAKTKPPNFRIVYGFIVGVSEPEFERMLREKIRNGEIIALDTTGFPPIIEFELLNNESIAMSTHCSATGVFKNFPLISFKTEEFTDSIDLISTRNKLLDWAIAKYGDQYHVSPMEDFSAGTVRKNFRWVAETYSIDITDIDNRVALTYRTLD